MSQQELQRVKVIENAVQGRITVAEASTLLQLSERQVQRCKARYPPDDVDWVHGIMDARHRGLLLLTGSR